jgi:hypothetical protein
LLEKCNFKTLDEFLQHFPGMTCDFSDAEREGFTLAIRSICSSESCPKISQNRTKRLRQIPVPTNIQAELDLVFSENPYLHPCDVKVHDVHAYVGETRIMKLSSEDGDEVWHSCGGYRTFLRNAVKYPSVLILQFNQSGCRAPPAEVVVFNVTYYLIACFHGNGTHFNASVHLGDAKI